MIERRVTFHMSSGKVFRFYASSNIAEQCLNCLVELPGCFSLPGGGRRVLNLKAVGSVEDRPLNWAERCYFGALRALCSPRLRTAEQ